MRAFRFGLRARLVGVVSAVLAGLLALTATLVVLRSEQALESMQRERVAAVTSQLAESLRYAVLARSTTLIDPSLRVFASTPDLERVEVLDEHRSVLSHIFGPSHDEAHETLIRVELPVRTRTGAPGDDDNELATFGVQNKVSRLVGYVVAHFSTASTARLQAQVRRDIIAAFAIVGSIGIFFVLTLASSVVKRTRLIANAAARVARGDMQVRVSAHGNDELAALAVDFNAMTVALEQQRRALDDVAQQLAERESLAALGRATAVIAHELKNPLGILLGAAEIIGNPNRPQTAREKAASIIVQEVPRLERTLNDLLHYARPTLPQRVAVDTYTMCAMVVERATHAGGPAANVSIEISGDHLSAIVDEHQVQQVLLNLLTNAAQAKASQVRIEISRAQERVSIAVIDDGEGVNPSIRAQLFRPFVTTKQRGVGLGLAGSRRVLRDNGGDLRFVDGPQGAQFDMLLTAACEENPT